MKEILESGTYFDSHLRHSKIFSSSTVNEKDKNLQANYKEGELGVNYAK